MAQHTSPNGSQFDIEPLELKNGKWIAVIWPHLGIGGRVARGKPPAQYNSEDEAVDAAKQDVDSHFLRP